MKTIVLLLAIFVGAEVRAQEPAPAAAPAPAPTVAAAKPGLSPVQLSAINGARKAVQTADAELRTTKAYRDYVKAAEKLGTIPEYAALKAAETQLKTIELLVK